MSEEELSRIQRIRISNKKLIKVTSTSNIHTTLSSVSSYQKIYRQFNSKTKEVN